MSKAKTSPVQTGRSSFPWSLRLFGMVPLFLASAFGAGMGVFAWVFSPSYRRKLSDNLALAGYKPGPIRRRAIIEAGRMIAESPYIWSHEPRHVVRKVLLSSSSTATLDAAEAPGKGVLILTPHLGSFETAARFYAARRPITVLYKPPKIAFVRRWLKAAREAKSVQAVPPTIGGLRAMVRALRRGEAVGLLPDHVPTEGDGVWADFFGQPAYTMTLPQRLVEMTGCAVVVAVGERLPGGRGWRVQYEPLNEFPTPDVINARFEAVIRRLPAQYLWAYNRYKRPPGVSSDDGTALIRDRDPDTPSVNVPQEVPLITNLPNTAP